MNFYVTFPFCIIPKHYNAYGKQAEHLDLEDCLHFPVNHSNNYVDPQTGAHTQTIEGLWSHVKDFLPVRGMKPKELPSYLGWFMWDRFSRQRKMDLFLHVQLPVATISRIGVGSQLTNDDDDDFMK